MSALSPELGPPINDSQAPPTDRAEELKGSLIPLDMIAAQAVTLHPDHLKSIAEVYEDEVSSQTQLPILLAAVDRHDKYLVVDGFYRLQAQRQLGAQEVRAVVRSVSMDEVLDERVFNVASHNLVEVSRLLETTQSAWHNTAWGQKVTLKQAFSLWQNISSGSMLPVSQDEVDGIKQWVVNKSVLWDIKPSKVLAICRVVAVASPDLVAQTRFTRRKHPDYYFSYGQLSAIAKAFPNDYKEQQALADVAQQLLLSTAQVSELASKAKDEPYKYPYELGLEISRQPQPAKAVRTRSRTRRSIALDTDHSGERSTVDGARGVGRTTLRAAEMPTQQRFTEFSRADWSQRSQRIIHVTNQRQVNRETERVAKLLGFEPNYLDIEVDGQAFFNKTISVGAGIETELISALLAGYLLPPPSLDRFFKAYQLGDSVQQGDLPKHKDRVHQLLAHLKVNDIVFYDANSRTLAGLKPVVIHDQKR